MTTLAAFALAACSSGEGLIADSKAEYRTTQTRAKPLEVPPDLTQLARESRYQNVGGVVSASGATPAPGTGNTAAGAASPVAVALQQAGDVRIERLGQKRWLVSSQSPEQLWPQVRAFWEKTGFTLTTDNPAAGVMETNWSENRAKLPTDVVRNLIGRLVGNLFDTGERDLFRTRLERADKGTEIYVSHRGIEEVTIGNAVSQTTQWRPRPNDPELEAEMVSRLMLALGAGSDVARAAAATGTAAAATPARARITSTSPRAAMEIDDAFDRAWRRVGLTLDRGGFTVEDRDRSAGTYFIRYVDPKAANLEEQNFFSRLFSGSGPSAAPVRFRIVLKAADEKTALEVLTSDGKPEVGELGRNIIDRLVSDLR